MRKTIALLLTTMMVTTMFTGCGQKETEVDGSTGMQMDTTESSDAEKEITLKFLQFAPEYGAAMNEMAEEYKKVKPNVTLEFEMLGNDYWSVLKTRINAGELPDVFMTYTGNANTTYGDYILDITGEPFLDNIQPSFLTGATEGDKILGLPLIAQAYGLMYDKRVFAEAGIETVPQTMEELEQVAITLSEQGITPSYIVKP